MDNETIATITVTYNRVNTLRHTLEALLAQTRRPDHILIVDNHSTEENRAALAELAAEHPGAEILWLSANFGGAGGFEQGMRYAAEHWQPDWYWIMDDDAYPRPDTLETLLTHRDLPDIGCLAPLIYGVDWQQYQLYHHKAVRKCHVKDAAKFASVEEMDAVETIDADAFVGPLFPRTVVGELGYPDGGMFIYGDDTEYTTRIRQRHTIYLIRDAVIDHNDPPAGRTGFGPETYWKLYYNLRNRALIANRYNHGFRKFLGWVYLTGELLWQTAYTLARPGLGKFRSLRFRCVWRGYADGMRGRSGKTIDPGEFMQRIRKNENSGAVT